MIKVLITGVGAIIGYGIIKSLRSTGRELFIVGCDIYNDAVGKKWSDKFVQAPLTSNEDYHSWISALIKDEEIDIVFPGIEQDSIYFSLNQSLFEGIDTKFVINSSYLVKLASDKWLMHKKLMEISPENCIETYLSGSYPELVHKIGSPFLFKPRISYAGKGISKVSCEKDFNYRYDQFGNYLMAQEIVGDEDSEYTVGSFGDGTGNIFSTIIFKRKLAQDGSTAKAYVVDNNEITSFIKKVSKLLKPLGPTNFQVRLADGVVRLLEINPRISSSSSIRTAFGYNEAEMCLNFFLFNEELEQPAILYGSAQRFIEDCIIYEGTNL